VGFGSKHAIERDSNIIQTWASKCTVTRGWQNNQDTALGKASVGSEFYATGKADGTVISLGDSGIAILQFDNPISDKEGADFCVFENGFLLSNAKPESHMELAFVEVSSDGINYFRFPAQSNIDTTKQIGNFEVSNASLVDGLAGKYIGKYGTPFDLNVFAHLSALNIGKITHVKIIDIAGNKDAKYPARDKNGNKIVDPWPTPFESSGFDLDAVGVINQLYKTNVLTLNNVAFDVYPNPINHGQNLFIKNNLNDLKIDIINAQGKTCFNQTTNQNIEIETSQFETGIYILSISQNGNIFHQKLIIK